MSDKMYIAEAPSNIAFLKYWGKEDSESQWPWNDSLSMTLSHCMTRTQSLIRSDLQDFLISFDGHVLNSGPKKEKIHRYLSFLKDKFHFDSFLELETENNFPTGSGVASSASGFAALTLSALAAWTDSDSFEELERKGFSLEKLAFLSRLGSGSSCRSFFGGYVVWEKGETSQKQAVKPFLSGYDWKLSDTVVILSEDEKKLSSSEAHKRVPTSPLFKVRLSNMKEKLRSFQSALSKRKMERLGALLEKEALEIHNLIMTAEKPFSYLSDATLEFLCWLRKMREEEGVKAYFTIDAGPNVHVITQEEDTLRFRSLLRKSFPELKFISDEVGSGPKLYVEDILE